MLVIIVFLICTLLVAFVSWYKTRSTNLHTIRGVFLGGKNNNYFVVASALVLTNLSANQFIGENESVYINNMSVMAWGITSVLAMLLVSSYLLPIYFKGGMITTPEFLAQRYDEGTKQLVSVVFLLSYLVNLLPPVLYGGAVALSGMFSLQSLLQISYWQSIWIMVWVLGIIGSLYTILGGLRAITVSDGVLGLGLLVIALLLPYYALDKLGEGSILKGIQQLLSVHTTHLNAIGSAQDAVPFSTIFTGMLLVNIYYWGVEQYIVQQALSAKSLVEAQKGMTLAALIKISLPLLINLPGLIAVHLYDKLPNTAAVFPLLAADVLPQFFLGITTALLFGAAITTYNAGLHASSTLFVMNIYLPLKKKRFTREPTEAQLVRVSKRFELLMSLLAMCTAPFILFVESGFYTYLQRVAGLFSMPIFTILVVGFLTKRVPPMAAKIGLIFFMMAYFICEYILNIQMHYLHVLAILFVATALLMLVLGWYSPSKVSTDNPCFGAEAANPIAWKNKRVAVLILLLMMIVIYIIFSPLGIASSG